MNTVGAPYSGKPNVRCDEGALGTPTPIHDDGLSPCVGNARNRQRGLPIRPGKPVLYSTGGREESGYPTPGWRRPSEPAAINGRHLAARPPADRRKSPGLTGRPKPTRTR